MNKNNPKQAGKHDDSGLRKAAADILQAIGEDPGREGLVDTPRRMAASMRFLSSGYSADVDAVINNAIFTEEIDDMIVVKDIEVYSMCEHHMLPFFGKAHVGYIPRGKVIGLSKIPRVVDVFSRRLQLQERLTNQIAHTLWRHLKPLGVGVVVEAHHLCMMMRGVQKQNSAMVSSSMLGEFRDSAETRSEFLSLISTQRRELH
jgi:GTP cyclohydrolase I